MPITRYSVPQESSKAEFYHKPSLPRITPLRNLRPSLISSFYQNVIISFHVFCVKKKTYINTFHQFALKNVTFAGCVLELCLHTLETTPRLLVQLQPYPLCHDVFFYF